MKVEVVRIRSVSGYAPEDRGDSAGARGRLRRIAVWKGIATIQQVLSGLRWRRLDDAGGVVGASAHIAGLGLSRHHGEGVVGGNGLQRKHGSAESS